MTTNRAIVRWPVFALAMVLAAAHGSSAWAESPRLSISSSKISGRYKISGAFTHQNLAVYLIHGKDVIPHKKILTLQEALTQKKIIVHETGSVRQLKVENLSKDEEVVIQAGDIVKGGRQDRVMAYDLIVPPESGKIPIAAFCVEAGRWQRRGSEDAARFSQSSGQLPGKALRLAVTSSRQQRLVWKNVKQQQDKLSRRLKKMATNAQSPSSLQLTLEDKDLQAKVDGYVQRLEESIAGKQDVIGFVVAINGQIESADIYGSSTLFRKMWPKLLRSTAVNAFTEQTSGRRFELVDSEEISIFLADDKGKRSETKVNDRIHVIQSDGPMKFSTSTRDQAHQGAILHRCDIAR